MSKAEWSCVLERLESLLISHEIVLGWQGFDETERQIRRRFQQRYINEKQSWHTLADAVLGPVDCSLIHETTRRPSHSVMRRLAADSRTIAQQEQRGAKEATMSLDSLYNVCKQNRTANSDLQSAIAGLLVQVQNPSASNAPAFIAQLQKICAALGRGGAQAGK
jgi:hypothetical protein